MEDELKIINVTIVPFEDWPCTQHNTSFSWNCSRSSCRFKRGKTTGKFGAPIDSKNESLQFQSWYVFWHVHRDSVVKGNKYDKAKCTQDEQAGSSLDSLNVAVHPVIEWGAIIALTLPFPFSTGKYCNSILHYKLLSWNYLSLDRYSTSLCIHL